MLFTGDCNIVGVATHSRGTFACGSGRVATAMRDDDDGVSSIHDVDTFRCCAVQLHSPPMTTTITASRDMGSMGAYTPWNIRCPDGYVLGGRSVCASAGFTVNVELCTGTYREYGVLVPTLT